MALYYRKENRQRQLWLNRIQDTSKGQTEIDKTGQKLERRLATRALSNSLTLEEGPFVQSLLGWMIFLVRVCKEIWAVSPGLTERVLLEVTQSSVLAASTERVPMSNHMRLAAV